MEYRVVAECSLLLKSCADAKVEPLSCISKASFKSGIIPLNWKMTTVVPIFKNGSRTRTDAASYTDRSHFGSLQDNGTVDQN